MSSWQITENENDVRDGDQETAEEVRARRWRENNEQIERQLTAISTHDRETFVREVAAIYNWSHSRATDLVAILTLFELRRIADSLEKNGHMG